MVRPSCSDKLNVKKGLWTPEEDVKMSAYVSKHGTGNCTAAAKKPGLRRCGKSCRLRRTNCLRPDPKHDSFTPQEEELIVRLHAAIGSRWFIIAQQLPGRTDNDVKNYWNTKLRKKLSEMGIDPVTHKPFSQILADYGNIGCLLEYGTRIGSLNRDLKTAFISKPEPPFASTPQPIPNIDTQLATTSLLPPKLEPIQECLFNTTKFSEDDPDSNQSLDLLDQLQAIKLVREASSCSNLSSSSSSSSSSSICPSSAQVKSALSFSWRDFLLDDAFPPSDHPQEQENVTLEEQQNVIPQDQIHGSVQGIDLAINPARSGFQVPSSCQSQTSFVDAMLDQENEIFFDFPNLLEEPFSY